MKLEEEIKQKNFKSEFEKAMVNLIYTFNSVDSQMKDFFKNFDLTSQQYNILRILRGQHPEPSTINLLKERMLDKMSDASRIVERLRIKELLERKTSASDRRSVDIIITQKGLDLLKDIDQSLSQQYEQIFENYSEEDARQLSELLDKLRDGEKK